MSNKKKIALLSNITVDLIIGKLCKEYDFYIPEGHDTWVQEVIDSNSALYIEEFDGMILLLDGTEARSWMSLEEGMERITLWEQSLNCLADKIGDVPVFISTIDIRENRIKTYSEKKYRFALEEEWYQFIWKLCEEKKNIFVFDLADTIADIGRDQFYSDKMWYISSMPYSRNGLNAVVKEIKRMMDAAFAIRKKVIAVDLDNTLWGNVIGEDGIEGIELSDHKEGQRYYDFQRQILEMKNRGIILAINSKNNEEDAKNAICHHPAMLLRDSDFVSRRINWENKAANQKEMEKELSLSEESFIFIDDNPVERETVKGECPEVTVPDFPADSTQLLTFAENIWFDYCRPLYVIDEDLNKTLIYQNEMERRREMGKSLNLDEYIKKLEIVVDIHRMKDRELDRVTQLINKTNQFNVTTKRYTKQEVKEIEANPDNTVYVVYEADKYGDSGLISVVILVEGRELIKIDTFLMSCRVMGRKLENVIMNEIASKVNKLLIAEYIPTTKNAPVRELYNRLGFVIVSETNERKIYELDTENYKKKNFDIYKEIQFEI